MVENRKPGSEEIETVRESDRRREQPDLVPVGRPQAEKPADLDLNEQLRTEVEELQRQVLELRESKHLDERSMQGWEWLARIAEENPDPVLQVSKHGVIQYRNPASIALCRQWNPSDEIIVPPAIHKIIKAAYARGQVIRQEMTVGDRTYLITVAPAPAPAKYVNLYASDITARKQAEEALHESEEKYRSIVETAREGIVMVDAEARIVFTNDRWLELFGYSREEAARTTLFDLVFPEDLAWIKERWESRRDGRKESYEARFRRKDGRPVWHLNSVVPRFDSEGRFLGTLVVVTDLTERRQAEEILRIKDSAIASSVNAIAMADLQGCLTYVNPAFLRLWGYEGEREVLGRSVLDFWEEPERAAEVMQAIQNGEGWVGELVALRKDGAYRNLYLSASTVRNDQGAPLCMMASFVDVTERKQAEEALRESEERLHLALGAARMGAWQWEVGTEHVVWSPELYGLLGYEPAEVTPTHQAFRRRIHPQDLARWEQTIRGSMERCEDYSCEFRIVWADGSIHWVEARGRYGYAGTEGGTKIMWMRGVMADIEQRKQAEEELRKLTATLETKVMQRTAELRHRAQQLQKLTLEMSEAEDRERRRLAAILHDDVQQIIAAAKFRLSMIRNRVKDDASLSALGEQIDQMLKEAVDKSRGLSHELSPAALHGDFAEALDQLARQMQAQHGLVVQVHATGPVPLQSDAVKAFLYRAAQELLFNAVKHAQVKEARLRVRRLGRCLCLTVSDRGRGFDPQELREAAGFGLLSIRERIGLLGGRMKIKSTPGKGSRFFIIVPDGETVAPEPVHA